MMKEIFQTSQIQVMMISKNFYQQTLDAIVNVYTFCAIQNVVVNIRQLMIMYIQLLQM